MPHILDEIVAAKREEVRRLRAGHPSARGRTSPQRGFVKAITQAEGLGLIAEVKKASPSKGLIAQSFDPVAIAKKYEEGLACAVSVLTDEKFFQGSLSYLENVREAISLPVLRKDFIIDPLQVSQSATAGADALLLIATILGDNQMQELYCAAIESGIEALIEIHTMKEGERVLKLSPLPPLIGINNRDLQTFEIDINTTLSIIKNIPKEIAVISESGITGGDQARALGKAGVRGLLVGEALMRAEDVAGMIRELSGR